MAHTLHLRATHTLTQVRSLKATPSRRGDHYALPPLPEVLFGREKDVQKAVACLSEGGSGRVVVVVGEPGEGKLAVAAQALKSLYDGGQALGGVWHCSLQGAGTQDEMCSRLVGGLSKVRTGLDTTLSEPLTLRRSPSKTLTLRSTHSPNPLTLWITHLPYLSPTHLVLSANGSGSHLRSIHSPSDVTPLAFPPLTHPPSPPIYLRCKRPWIPPRGCRRP